MKFFNKHIGLIKAKKRSQKIESISISLNDDCSTHNIFVHYDLKSICDMFEYDTKKDAMHDFKILARYIK